MFLFCTPPWKHQKTFGFHVFSGATKMGTLVRNGTLPYDYPLRIYQNFYSKELTEAIFWLINNQAINP